MFVGAVAAYREVAGSVVRQGYGQGRVVDAQTAKAGGMVDDVATLDEVVWRLALRIGQGKTFNASSRAVLQGRARLISAMSRQPPGAAPRRATSAVALRREIDLLTL